MQGDDDNMVDDTADNDQASAPKKHVDYPEDKKLVEIFRKRFSAAEEARKPFDDKCDLIDKHYEPFYIDWNDAKDGHKNLRTGHVFHIVETMSANMVEPDPNWDLSTMNPADEQSLKATRVALSDTMYRDGWPKKNMRLTRAGNRYGLAVAMIGWDLQERVKHEQVEQPHTNPVMRFFGKTQTVNQKTTVTTRDDATVSLIDRRDFWWQPRAVNIDECDWVLHRAFIPMEMLEDGERAGFYRCISNVRPSGDVGDSASLATPEVMKDRRRENDEGVEVITMWDKTTGKRTKVANRTTIIAHDDWPYDHEELPFACYTPIPMEDRFEGLSPVEPLIPLQEATWQMENDRMRGVAMALNPTLLVQKQLKGGTEFHIKPGGRIFVDDVSQIKQLQLDSQSNLGFQEVQAYLGYMQQVSGVSPFIAGSDPSGYGINQDTATGVNQLAGAAGRRIGFHIQQLQDCVSRIGRQMVQLMQQFLTEDRMIRVNGDSGQEWVQLSPADIPMMFSLTVKGSTENLNKQTERQQSIEFIREIAQLNNLPSPDGRQFTIVPALNHVVESFGMNPEEFWIGQTQDVQAQQQAATDQATAQAQQAQNDAAMAHPEMQMAMQQQQGGDPSQQDPSAQLEKKLFESINFKDMPADAQMAMLQQIGLPTDGVAAQSQLDDQAQMAKIQQMHSQAQSQGAGMDNAV